MNIYSPKHIILTAKQLSRKGIKQITEESLLKALRKPQTEFCQCEERWDTESYCCVNCELPVREFVEE